MSLLEKSNLVTLKNNLKKDKIKNDIQSAVIEKIFELPDYKKYKFDVEFIKYVCNMLEHLIKKEYGLDKKEIALNIIGKVFDLNEVELEAISNIIEFLWVNGQIQARKITKWISRGFYDWFKKKVL